MGKYCCELRVLTNAQERQKKRLKNAQLPHPSFASKLKIEHGLHQVDALMSKNDGKKHSDWIPEIDYLRGFAILTVILGHAIVYGGSRSIDGLTALSAFNTFTYCFIDSVTIQIFIFISGFVLQNQYWHDIPLKSFYKKRALSIIPPYIIFSFLYIFFYHLVYGFKIGAEIVFFKLLTAEADKHMWFFAIIIQLYILYPPIRALYNFFERKNRIHVLLIFSLLAQISWSALMLRYQKIIHIHVFVEFFFYFVLGMFVNRHFDDFKLRIKNLPISILFTVSIILNAIFSIFIFIGLIKYGYYNSIPKLYFLGGSLLTPFIYIPTFLLIYRVSTKISSTKNIVSSFIRSTGRLSFGMYLIHMFFIMIVSKYLLSIGLDQNNWLTYFALFISTVVLTYASTYLISRIPYSGIVIGRSPSK
jgi:peptidoglycan/LPS O-acetylase OafA/YrhL